MSRSSISSEITGIVMATIGASVIMSLLQGVWWHWLLVVPGLIVGILATKSVR